MYQNYFWWSGANLKYSSISKQLILLNMINLLIINKKKKHTFNEFFFY